jgi:UDP-N-acetylmuramyl pentapeptide phosphotransferase/UDP-N-acetylglucosamine-1-phosphate transferase
MPEFVRILLAFATGALGAAILCRGVMMLGAVDAPTEARKTQKVPVPTLGGIGVAAGAALALGVNWMLGGWPLTSNVFIVIAGALASLAIGLADDLTHAPPVGRLLALLAVALMLTVLGIRADVLEPWPGVMLDLPVILGVAGSILWIVVVVNAVNFMDGANGLSMGMAAIAAAGLAAAASFLGMWNIALLAAALSGGLAGFLVWNIPGKLFVGDTGAYFAGAVLAGLSLEFVRVRPDLLFVPPLLLMPFLSDVILTVIWRTMHGKKFWEAHRDHAYQIAIKAGLKHWQVSAIHAVWALNAVIIGIIAAIVGREVPLIAFLVLLVLSTWLHLWVRKLGVKAGLVGAKIA